ncbi:MAG: sigma-E factor negative regulatory protein [Rubrivivax sp.]|nr:sigma-E factor negative regulatory protein [Rubrivivax sp.]
MNRSVSAQDTAPDTASPRQWLSDLADGQLQDDALADACRRWGDDAEARRTWHAYHLIGDVLRAEDLAADARRDAAFLATLRTRLEAEPVVLAPSPAASPSAAVRQRHLRRVWWTPMAAAAGFVAVAGVVVVLRQAAPEAGGADPQLASGGSTLSPLRASTPPAAAGQLLRDPHIDAYLSAHREALAGSPPALPGGGVRNVDFNVPQR